jgi:hypothetical protein
MINAVVQTPAITRIYRGSDGSALYLRELDNAVYGFGEHPGKKYAYVLRGTLQGDRISAKFWDIPKGTRTATGTVELQVSQLGGRLVRKSGSSLIGANTWEVIAPGSFPWPVKLAAGFQKFAISDLDGAFEGEDGSRHYIREFEGDVVWVAEAPAQPQTRPAWVSVFVGKRIQRYGKSGNP